MEKCFKMCILSFHCGFIATEQIGYCKVITINIRRNILLPNLQKLVGGRRLHFVNRL